MNTNQLPDFYDIIPDKYKEKIIYDTVTEKEINSFKEYVPLNWIFGLKYKRFLKNLTDDVKKYASDSTDFFAETINMYFNNQLIEYRFIDVSKTHFESSNHFYDFCRSNFETVFTKTSFKKFFVVKKDDFENIRTAYLLDEDYEFDLFCLINFHNRGFGTELLSVYNEYVSSHKTQNYNDFCLSTIGRYCEIVFYRNSNSFFNHNDFLNISNNFVQKKFSIKELTKELPSEFLDFVLPKTKQTSFVERTMTTEELPF